MLLKAVVSAQSLKWLNTDNVQGTRGWTWPPAPGLATQVPSEASQYSPFLEISPRIRLMCRFTPPHTPQWHSTICSIFFLAEQCGKEFWFPISSHPPLCFLMGSPAFTSFCWQSNQGPFPARMGRFPCVCQPPKKLGVYYNLDPSGKTIRNQQALE